MTGWPSIACVCMPSLALQLLIREQPAWREEPVAVIDEDRPQGRLLSLNRAAQKQRLRVGMSYAAGLSLVPSLRARVVETASVEREVEEIIHTLHAVTPHVEPAADLPGVFWLDPSGMQRLYGSSKSWGEALHKELRGRQLWPRVVVGWSRFATRALAQGGQGSLLLFESPDAEHEAALMVPLSRLGLEHTTQHALGRLGIHDIGGLLQLSAEGVMRRFGERALALWRLAANDWRPSMRPVRVQPPLQWRHLFDEPVAQATHLVFVLKRLLHRALTTLASRHQALGSLRWRLLLEDQTQLCAEVEPARPTLEERALLELVRLKLEATKLKSPVTELDLYVEQAPAESAQLTLFRSRAQRNIDAAQDAIAKLRAALGPEAVTCATLCSGNLPEAQFRWEPVDKVSLPRPAPPPRVRTLVRRIANAKRALPPQDPKVRDDGWMLKGLERGPVLRTWGPYLISGGWWAREVRREYHFSELQDGTLCWVYYDSHRRRWFQQGTVC